MCTRSYCKDIHAQQQHTITHVTNRTQMQNLGLLQRWVRSLLVGT